MCEGVTYLNLRVCDRAPRHPGVSGSPQPLVQDVLAPPIPIAGIDIPHATLLADVRVVVALERLGHEVAQQNSRARCSFHALGEVQALQASIFRILLLTRVEHEDVDELAVRVNGRFDGGRKLTHG